MKKRASDETANVWTVLLCGMPWKKNTSSSSFYSTSFDMTVSLCRFVLSYVHQILLHFLSRWAPETVCGRFIDRSVHFFWTLVSWFNTHTGMYINKHTRTLFNHRWDSFEHFERERERIWWAKKKHQQKPTHRCFVLYAMDASTKDLECNLHCLEIYTHTRNGMMSNSYR